MKFAQELDREVVPEWRQKYLGYKIAKKKLKPLVNALREFHNSNRPSTVASFPTPVPAFHNARPSDLANNSPAEIRRSPDTLRATTQLPLASVADQERLPFASFDLGSSVEEGRRPLTRYGSIFSSPPLPFQSQGPHVPNWASPNGPPSSLNLPEPAISEAPTTETHKRIGTQDSLHPETSQFGSASHLQPDNCTPKPKIGHSRTWDTINNASPLRKLFSRGGTQNSPYAPTAFPDQLDAYRPVKKAQDDFFAFLDQELEKIDSFYLEKEKEATHQLGILRAQLHEYRDQRIKSLPPIANGNGDDNDDNDDGDNGYENHTSTSKRKLPVQQIWNAIRHGRVGPNSVAMQTHGTPEAIPPMDQNRDYIRRKVEHVSGYRTAKKQLKTAILEYYRGLELLKSFALLNRTAFRKINKKYDKTTKVASKLQYLNGKVANARFVSSQLIEDHIQTIEDLYARYFEANNHKVTAGKLRQVIQLKHYHGDAMLRTGLFLGAGSVFMGFGLSEAYRLLYSPDSALALQTSYALQLYAGYFFMLFLMLFFALCCQIWTRSRVNYVFIFELDTRNHLDWRQVAELPSLLYFFLGFFLWLNFARQGSKEMYIYFPAILLSSAFLVLFCPFRILHWRARFYFLTACFRLVLSGLFPVEFRDFFFGDMFCSTTYSLANIEVFFCLYAHAWGNPNQCNSSHSRLMGFLGALPSIWRALQCLRRYYDTRNMFPHLANFGKYTAGTMFYMSLSLYRLDKSHALLSLLIFFGTINSTYCSIWDLAMDWSLLDVRAKWPLLRNVLVYKYVWFYYLAMIIDPILRFNWLCYVIWTNDLQHSTFISFIVALSEVFRRGIWTLLRVENEQQANQTEFKASREVPLPYNLENQDYTPAALESGVATQPAIPSSQSPPIETTQGTSTAISANNTPASDRLSRLATGVDQGHYDRPSSSVRFRHSESPIIRHLSNVAKRLHSAHMEDFQRKKPNKKIAEVTDSSDSEGES